MTFKNGVKNIQPAGYNGARTVGRQTYVVQKSPKTYIM